MSVVVVDLESEMLAGKRSFQVHGSQHEYECGEEGKRGAHAHDDLMCNQCVVPKLVSFLLVLDVAMIDEDGTDVETSEQG